jgi:ribose transport system ATP-binding protein
MREEVLRIERVTYLERGVVQLEDFNLTLFAGEIVGLLPVNSHGLTALINLLRNNLPLHYGYIYCREEQINSWHTPNPHYNRIGVIQSESSLVGGLTVADNIFVLRPGFKTWLLRPSVLSRQLQPLLHLLDIRIPADAYVEELTIFQRFVVELIKAVVAGSRLVILRDVSTFISESELTQLHAILRHYAAQGMTFLYIGFHFEELEQICSRTALLINGRITKVLRREEFQTHSLDFYDRRTWEKHLTQQSAESPAVPVLQVSHLFGGMVENLSFSVRAGECLVLQDLENQIFADLLSLLQGERPMEGGEIRLRGTPFLPAPTREIAILKEQPADTMIFREMSYFDNLYFTIDHRLPKLWRSSRLQKGLKRTVERPKGELFDLRPEQLTKTEKYDLVYHRILLQNPAAVFCIQPFKGADLELRKHIWGLLEALMERGVAVIILAVNLADALSLASRLIRIHRSAPVEVYEQHDFAKIPFSAPWLDLYRQRGE